MAAKIPFLSGKPPRQRLKRAVPKDIQALVKQQNWLRPFSPKLTESEIKRLSRRFEVETDDLIRSYRNRAMVSLTIDAATPLLPRLRREDINALLENYALGRREKIVAEGAYVLAGDRQAQGDRFADAVEDVILAEIEASGAEVHTHEFALKLLVGNGLLSQTEYRHITRLPNWRHEVDKDEEFRRFCGEIRFEDLSFARTVLEVMRGGPAEALRRDIRPRPPSYPRQSEKSFGELIESFWAIQRPDLTNSRKSQIGLALRLATDIFGNETPLGEISREMCKSFSEYAPRIPAYAAQHFKGLTALEAIDAYKKRAGEYAYRPKEAQKYLQIATSLFKHAVDEEFITKNPMSGIHVQMPVRKKFQEKEDAYQPFPVEALNKLFQHPIFYLSTRNDGKVNHHYWAPIIALFSGMRMNEILQLEKEDVRQEDTTWVFAVTDEEHGEYDRDKFAKRLKTPNSLRKAPIHPSLIKFGLLEWLEKQAAGRLFADATNGSGEKPSDRYSKQFSRVTKKQGVWISRRQVFHSFRNNFTDGLRRAGASIEIREAICGWDPRSMDKNYGHGHAAATLKKYVDKVSYKGLDCDHLISNRKYL